MQDNAAHSSSKAFSLLELLLPLLAHAVHLVPMPANYCWEASPSGVVFFLKSFSCPILADCHSSWVICYSANVFNFPILGTFIPTASDP